MEHCYRHPDRETGVSCSNCGRPICPDCMTTTSVGMRCPECARQTTRVVRGVGAPGTPALTTVLIGVNVFVAVAAMLAGARSGVGLGGGGTLIDHGALSRATIDSGEWWRLITAGFLHAGLLHLAFNMYALYLLGGLLESSVGRLRFALLYLVSLLAGSFGALLLQPAGYTVGASGAVFGLMGATLVLAIGRGVTALSTNLALLLGINLLFTFGVSGISIGGHLGGLLGGTLAALVMFELAPRARLPQVAAIGIATVLGALAVAGAIAVSAPG